MQLFSKKTDKEGEATSSKSSAELRQQLNHALKELTRFETFIIVLVVTALLGFTTLKMLHFVDPPIDEIQSEANKGQYKKITIDPKSIQRIKDLVDSKAQPAPNIDSGRSNPFTE